MAAYGTGSVARIVHAITEVKAFRISNMSAEWYPTSLAVPVGRLDTEPIRALRSAGDGDKPIYVIFSYATPIAWRLASDQGPDQWRTPGEGYSRTTRQHKAIAAQGMRAWEERIMNTIGEPQ